MSKTPLLQVKHLRVQMHTDQGLIQPVDKVDLTIQRGEMFALVGESGCGKSLTALALSRLLPENAYICEGSEIILDGISLHTLSEDQMRQRRGEKIAMIFQDPAAALDPILTVGEQIREAILAHDGKEINVSKRMFELLEKVRLSDPDATIKKYPHQLSGGMKQRIMIAMALAQSPDLLIADEPTTALDVTTQAKILNLLKELNEKEQMAVLLITHDLGIVAQMADNIAVMYAGHVVEQAAKKEFLKSPRHPYSQQLFASLPEEVKEHKMLATIPGIVPTLDKNFTLCRFKDRCAFVFGACEATMPKLTSVTPTNAVRCHWYDPEIMKHMPSPLKIQALSSIILNRDLPWQETKKAEEPEVPLLRVHDLRVLFPIQSGILKRTVGYVRAVDGVSFKINEGQTLALVGESGCGKTTVGKAVLRLIESTSGVVEFQGENLFMLSRSQLRQKRSALQMIFQDPFSSMDPRMQIDEILDEGMRALKIGTNDKERQDRIDVLLDQVGLSPTVKTRYPHELSGGQKQRVAIARALAVGAQLIVCDEPTSALDVSVQAQILNLLKSLQKEFGISYLFITHNISVVNYIADYVAVMYLGRIVEYGPVQAILQSPKHPYTQALLRSVPSVKKTEGLYAELKGSIPDPSHPPAGCHFATRCPYVHERCLEQYPPSYEVGGDHQVKCYLESPEEKGQGENNGQGKDIVKGNVTYPLKFQRIEKS